MSRLETGILQIHKEDKNLYETIRHAVAGVVPEAASKGIESICELRRKYDEFVMTANGRRKQFIIILDNCTQVYRTRWKDPYSDRKTGIIFKDQHF